VVFPSGEGWSFKTGTGGSISPFFPVQARIIMMTQFFKKWGLLKRNIKPNFVIQTLEIKQFGIENYLTI
jgi:hypothetical protein